MNTINSQYFSGIDIRPVRLFIDEKCKSPIAGYRELRVTGRVKVDQAASGVRVEYECPLCGFKKLSHWDRNLGLHFEDEYDDWPDAFQMEQRLTMYIFVKSRLAQFIVDMRFCPVTIGRFEDMKLFDWE